MRFIALLRAINVGGHTVRMEQLRTLFDSMGFTGVETFIASGNVCFDTRKQNTEALEGRIGQELQRALGYEVTTFIRTPAELAGVSQHPAFPKVDLATGKHLLYVAFLKGHPDSDAVQRLMKFRNEIDDFHLHDRELYWLRRMGGDSAVAGPLLEKTLRMPATTRNITTVRKLALKYHSA